MSAFDLEKKIHLPKGNIFHGDLSWPFAETEEEVWKRNTPIWVWKQDKHP